MYESKTIDIAENVRIYASKFSLKCGASHKSIGIVNVKNNLSLLNGNNWHLEAGIVYRM